MPVDLISPVNGFLVFVEAVEAQLVLNPEQDEDAAGHPEGKADYIYGGIAFGFGDISKSDFHIVF